jgi:hypothetical protein
MPYRRLRAVAAEAAARVAGVVAAGAVGMAALRQACPTLTMALSYFLKYLPILAA